MFRNFNSKIVYGFTTGLLKIACRIFVTFVGVQLCQLVRSLPSMFQYRDNGDLVTEACIYIGKNYFSRISGHSHKDELQWWWFFLAFFMILVKFDVSRVQYAKLIYIVQDVTFNTCFNFTSFLRNILYYKQFAGPDYDDAAACVITKVLLFN